MWSFKLYFSSEATLKLQISVRPFIRMYLCPPVCQLCLEGNLISLSLIKIEDYIFLCKFLSSMSIYSMNICPSIYQSGYKRYRCINIETLISWLLFKIDVWFCENLFINTIDVYTYIHRLGYNKHKCIFK